MKIAILECLINYLNAEKRPSLGKEKWNEIRTQRPLPRHLLSLADKRLPINRRELKHEGDDYSRRMKDSRRRITEEFGPGLVLNISKAVSKKLALFDPEISTCLFSKKNNSNTIYGAPSLTYPEVVRKKVNEVTKREQIRKVAFHKLGEVYLYDNMAGSWTKYNPPSPFTTDELFYKVENSSLDCVENREKIKKWETSHLEDLKPIRYKTTDSLPNFGIFTRIQWPHFKEGDPADALLKEITVSDEDGTIFYNGFKWSCVLERNKNINKYHSIIKISKSKIPCRGEFGEKQTRYVASYFLSTDIGQMDNLDIVELSQLPKITLVTRFTS